MADIANNVVNKSFAVSLAEGESIRMQVLNGDGSVKETKCTDACPAGKSFSGYMAYSGNLT
jgi:hypothetical protein